MEERALVAEIGWVESTPPRVASLRTVLREYLLALDSGDEFVAQMLERCTFGPRVGPGAVLLIPLARVPGKRS
jgi:hypothetical protein